MSPKQGRRRTSGTGGSAASAPIAARRLGLLIFGVTFVVLFLVVAISEGIGDPSIPSGDIVLVEDAPGDTGNVTEAEFERALAQSAAQTGVKKVPKPDDPQYDEMKESALNSLFEAIWLQGLAAEMGIEVSDEEAAKELKKVKDENFKSEAEFKKFLKDAKFTEADVDERIRLQVISTQIQEELQEEVPEPTDREIEQYYEAAKSTQFTQPATRSVRMVKNKDRKKVETAKAALDKDNTSKSWDRVAKKFSEDSSTKDKGGLQENVTEGSLEPALDEAVFDAVEGQVSGPVKTDAGFFVFEVQNSSPAKVQSLEEVESQIQSTLAQRAEQDYFNAFVSDFNTTWQQRTFCADGFLTERCANFKGSGHPATAPPACYEANPDGGRPDACPAPVFQLVPALPGTVTPLEPRGTPMAQRPVPVGGGEAEEAAPTGLPPGVTVPSE